MNEEIQYLTGSSIRLVIFCFGNLMSIDIFIRVLMNCRKNMVVYRVFWIVGKVFIQDLLLYHLLQYYFGDERWYKVLYSCFVLVMAFVAHLVFYYTFSGEFLKIALAGICSEWVATFTGYFSLCTINFLEKRSNLFCIVESFHWLDVLIPFLQWILLYWVIHHLGGFLERYKHTQLRYKKILWAFFVCYFITAPLTTFVNNQVAMGVFLYVLLISMIFSAVVLLAAWRYHTRIAAEQDLLKIQLNAMEFHYTAVQDQIQQMEKSRLVLGEQMKEIVQLEQSPAADLKIAEYLKQLKMEYEEIRAGVYCDNWMVDAVLCYHCEKLRKEGILFDCSMQGSINDAIEERDLVQLYLTLLDWGLQANRNMQEDVQESVEKQVYLHTSTVKKQLVINFFSNCAKNSRIPLKELRRHVKKYGGIIEVQKEHKGVRVILALKK